MVESSSTTRTVSLSLAPQEKETNANEGDQGPSKNASCTSTKEQQQQQHQEQQQGQRSSPTTMGSPCLTRSNSIALLEATTKWQKLAYLTAGLVVGVPVCWFAVSFPLWLFPAAAVPTYQTAGYVYQVEQSHFDHTAWTYGTDYLIAVAMMYQMAQFPTNPRSAAVLTWRSKALLTSYAVSVMAGGVAHEYYTTLASRNTWHFRCLWTLCVGSVTAGVTALGTIATELVRQDEMVGLAWLPAIPAWFWSGVGAMTTAACAAGWFSYQRPACDIFVAGVAQSIPTFYVMAQLARGLPTLAALDVRTRTVGLVAFIMMSATLPTYPVAVQYTHFSLGTINALLHVWLCVAWSAQGWTLRKIATILAQQEDGAVHAMIPHKK